MRFFLVLSYPCNGREGDEHKTLLQPGADDKRSQSVACRRNKCIRATPGATANSGIFTVAVAHILLALIEDPEHGCRQLPGCRQ
ncbi:hypothetical protein KAU08_02915, partial [bacterium]|nr:hypothetical protein [bacterium]